MLSYAAPKPLCLRAANDRFLYPCCWAFASAGCAGAGADSRFCHSDGRAARVRGLLLRAPSAHQVQKALFFFTCSLYTLRAGKQFRAVWEVGWMACPGWNDPWICLCMMLNSSWGWGQRVSEPTPARAWGSISVLALSAPVSSFSRLSQCPNVLVQIFISEITSAFLMDTSLVYILKQ